MQLLTITDERKVLLEGAEHVHQFVRDVDETDDRMSDKVLCLCIYVRMCISQSFHHIIMYVWLAGDPIIVSNGS